MKAMIFAAGEGRRMRPLTLATPKPLLRVGDMSLLERQIHTLAGAGVLDIVINVSYLAEQIIHALENMELPGVHIDVSVEDEPLETGGGILQALPYLGDSPFILINGDIWSDYDISSLTKYDLPDDKCAHLVLVDNPLHHPQGDFELNEAGLLAPFESGQAYTFSGISLIHPELIEDYPNKRECFPLVEALRFAMANGEVSGEHHSGRWVDVGTPERLDYVRELVLENG